jgi:two-component system alkaline phosphatase synthesis response regulator PhoP
MDENTMILLALKNEVEALGLSQKLIFKDNQVLTVKTKKEIIDFLQKYNFDLLITDMQIEDTDAIDICKEVRQIKNIQQPYIIVFSERPEDYIQSLALDAGVDDYILRPFKANVILARIKALMVRKSILKLSSNVPTQKLVIDEEKHIVFINSKEIELPRKEFNILKLLYSEPERVFTREEIVDRVSRKDWLYKDHTIDVYIFNLRKMIGSDIIQTIKGVGYKLSLV